MNCQLFLSVLYRCAAILTLCSMSSAWAGGNGVLTVTAKIISSTCSVGINGKSSAVVSLPDISTGDFKNTSDALNRTPFSIDISNCSDVAQGALKVIVTRPAEGTTAASVPAITGGAKDSIEFRISNVTGKSPAWGFTGRTAEFIVPDLINGNISLPYTVGYQAKKVPVNAGTISSNLTVSLSYK